MRNIKMVIEYDGSGYHGFQKQAGQNLPTIQGVLEDGITQLVGHPVQVTGAGRTDAGVHAMGQVVNFYSETTIPTGNIARALNTLLPEDIIAREATEVPHDFHAQFWAKKKTYRYTIYNNRIPSVFHRKHALFIPVELDVTSMREAAATLVGKHDFGSFKAAGATVKSSVRTIYMAKIEKQDPLIHVYLEANGFLYNMVRIITGTLIYVGSRKIRATDMKSILESGQRASAGPTVPPHGLFLMRVDY